MKTHEFATVFSDGSSRGNPGRGGWGAIVAWGDTVKELGGREVMTTNNRMELTAALSALMVAKGQVEKVVLYTDSRYVINGSTKWVEGWKRNGWMTQAKEPVLNKDLWVALSEAMEGLDIDWKYVGGHIGIPGNERCDEIATSFADDISIDLYSGDLGKYSVDLNEVVSSEEKKSLKKKKSSGPAYSYASLVDGVFMTHGTWAECESRVKGKSGAKFRKAMSAIEEGQIKKEWGV